MKYDFKGEDLNILGCLFIAVVVIIILAASLFIPTLILWGAWMLVIVPLFNAPPIGFWGMFLIWLAISVIGGLFKTTVLASSKN